jgi:hypothetical protein
MRSFFAVLAGFFAVPIISFTCDYAFHVLHPAYGPDAYFGGGVALIVLIYGTFSVLIGGYITGMIARHRQVLLGVILGCLGLLIAIPFNIKTWHQAPAWYHLVGLILVVPVSAWGAHLAGKRQERRAASAS